MVYLLELIKGIKGDQGDTGAQGATGDQGVQGHQGDDGAQGEQGTEYPWEGEWSSATAYAVNDCVEYNGSGYVCIQAGTNQNPSTATTYWDLLVEKGNQGDQGDQGHQGNQGAQGDSYNDSGNVGTTESSATPSIDVDDYDMYRITALEDDITSVSISGTPFTGQKLIVQIKDDGTAREIAWGSSFEANGVDLPTTTTISKLLTVGFIYNGSKWGCVAVSEEA